MASAKGNKEVVLALLDKGANFEAKDKVLCVRLLYRRKCACLYVFACVCV